MTDSPPQSAAGARTPFDPSVLPHARFVRGHDWTASPLGSPSGWPAPLRFAASLVFDSTLPMFLAWGEDLAMVYNDAYAPLLSAKHPRALGAPLRAVWADVWEDVEPLIAQALAGEGLHREDLRLVTDRDGQDEDVWFTFSYTPLRDEDGAVRGLVCTVLDTTEKVRARHHLAENAAAATRRDAHVQETEERYRLARLATNDAIWDWRLDDGHVIWNRALFALFGHDLEQTSADWWLEHIHPDDRPAIAHDIHAVIDGSGTAWSGEYRFLRADGGYAEIFDRGTVLRDEGGRPVRMIGAMLDLSGRKAAERALRESERLFRTLFESIDEGFCVIEFLDGSHGPLSDYVHVMANPAYASNAGIEDVVGQRVRDMVPLEAEGWVEIYRKVLVTGEPIRFERELEHTGRYLELAALRIEPAERRQVAVLFQDITQRHRAELALRDWNDALEKRVAEEVAQRARTEDALRQSQKMEAVGQLTGGIAHDFNNMLAVISNALELLGRRTAGADERARQYVDMARGGVRRAAQLTQRLLAFSRQQALQPATLCADELVAGMSELLRHSLGPSIAVEMVPALGLWSIHADSNQLESALLNLVVNARDAMEHGGRLTIETANARLGARAAAEFPGLAPGDYVTIAVADTGAGMAPEVVAKAFEPFFTTKEVGRGTGLGLSQVYGFVRQSGGHVRIDSAPGRGTVVTLYLQRHAGPAGAAARPVEAEPVPLAHADETVLVVEDEDAVRVLLAEMLAELGYRVLAAPGAADAMRLLGDHPGVALMITDVLMPETNGRELAAMAQAGRPQLKVLFTSGHPRDVLAGAGGAEADLPLLRKPYAIGELARRVRGLLDAA
jgi:PAS domain S-box-containing protein